MKVRSEAVVEAWVANTSPQAQVLLYSRFELWRLFVVRKAIVSQYCFKQPLGRDKTKRLVGRLTSLPLRGSKVENPPTHFGRKGKRSEG